MILVLAGALLAGLSASACGATRHASAATAQTGGEHYGTGAVAAPTLEQLAYRVWGGQLEAACPGGSLKFTVSREPSHALGADIADARGGSWGDCHPWVKAGGRWPERCATAMHEAGHETGLPDRPGAGGLMDNTRMIIGQTAFVHGHGRVHRVQSWTGIPDVCQPGYR